MNTENIAKGMMNLQDAFLRHSFYMTDFMQDQTKRTISYMKRYPWINKNGLKVVNDSIDYSRAANRKFQQMWDENFQGIRKIIG